MKAALFSFGVATGISHTSGAVKPSYGKADAAEKVNMNSHALFMNSIYPA